ncbi:UNVERIFIED_CONTAM: hypothetical protein FKN15_063443 [Acipenser sinensis]
MDFKLPGLAFCPWTLAFLICIVLIILPGLPVSSLDPASPPLVEGSAVAVAAVCTSWGVVPPTVAWETGLEGSSQLNQAAGGKVTNKFWVKPNRVMNGEKLDCLITHQSLKEPRRIPYTIVVHCTSWGVVPPTVAWETGLEGSSQLNQAAGGKVTNKFWVKPNRVMNGEKLDCLITHQSLKEPRRIPYTIVVHYPPDVSLTGYENDWFVGMEGGALKCMGKGNPEPNHFTWKRLSGQNSDPHKPNPSPIDTSDPRLIDSP